MLATPPTKLQLIHDKYDEGGSDVEVAALLNITLKKFYELVSELPELALVVERGRTVSEAWWMKAGRKNLYNKEFNAPLYNFQMKNRFGWADKVDTTDKSGVESGSVDQMRADLSKALAKLGKSYPELLSGTNLNQQKEST